MAEVEAKGDRLVSAYQAGAILARAAVLMGEDGHADMADLVDSFEVGYMDALKAAVKEKYPVCGTCGLRVTDDPDDVPRHYDTGLTMGYAVRPHYAYEEE